MGKHQLDNLWYQQFLEIGSEMIRGEIIVGRTSTVVKNWVKTE